MPHLPSDDLSRPALDTLEQETRALRFDAPSDDALAALGWAGRLAALGRPAALADLAARWAVGGELRSALERRATEGCADLRGDGQELAHALIEAQDLRCACVFDPRIWSAAGPALAAWMADADELVLDDEAAAFLDAWLVRFPLPDAVRLGPLLEVVGATELIALAAGAERGTTQRVESDWERIPTEEAVGLRLAAAPFEALDWEIARAARSARFPLLGRGTWSLRASLGRDRSLLVELWGDRDDGPASVRPVAVSIGGLPLLAAEAGDGVAWSWSYPTQGMTAAQRSAAVRGAIQVRFSTGDRVVVG
jgi:hypothetical protein